MISLNTFLACIQENIARIREYRSGGDGSGGGCDCIGLIIGAVRLAGGKWTGTHGSNWAARNAMRTLEPLYSPADLFLGEVVYKVKHPGDEGYSLPERYDKNLDDKDYYHVGVVTSLSPLCITHCTNVPGGIKRDSALGMWRFGGCLEGVEYPEAEAARPTLRKGDRGSAVKEMQQLLMAAGYSVGGTGADGIFGRNTESGVLAFQADAGLTPDGVCGPLTWAALLAGAPEGDENRADWVVHIPGLDEETARAFAAAYQNAYITRGDS